MRISFILKQLNISNDELLGYGEILEMNFSDPKTEIDEETLTKIKELHANPVINKKIKEQALKIKARRVGAYFDGSYYKMFGKIKWFGDQATGKDYGFIEVPRLGDVYFNSGSIKELNYGELRSEKIVILSISIKDFGNEQRRAAKKVISQEGETDLFFMLHTIYRISLSTPKDVDPKILEVFIAHFKSQQGSVGSKELSYLVNLATKVLKTENVPHKTYRYFKQIFYIFHATDFVYNDLEKLKELTNNYITSQKYDYATIDFLLDIRSFCRLETNEALANFIQAKTDQEHQFNFWLNHSIDIPFSILVKQIAGNLVTSPEKEKILEKLSIEEINSALDEAFQQVIKRQEEITDEQISNIINLSKRYDKELDLNPLGENKLFELWSKEYINYLPIKGLRQHFEKEREKLDLAKPQHKSSIQRNISSLFTKLAPQEIKDFFSSCYYEEELINNRNDFEEILFILDNVQTLELRENLVEKAYTNSSEFYKLQLFIQDYTDKIDFVAVVIYTGLLEPKIQKLFFKKLIKLISEEKIVLDLEDLNRISTIDYKTSELAKEIDGVGLDFSLSIILQLLNDLQKGRETSTKTLFDLIAKQVKKPDDLLVIDGFFDRCNGRTVLRELEEKDGEEVGIEKKYTKEKDDKNKPRFAAFCDGRKAIDTRTGNASSCNKSGFEFWWCENAQCYEVCRTIHKAKDWKQYNLEDILQILKIPYSDSQYEILIAMVNKTNRFLEHLTCKTCEKILKPVGKQNYGFWRVSNFHCPDENCEEHTNHIYLSHCLNGHCQGIIDSRESVKCKPHGHGENCGWYICNNCYACCSTKKLRGRKYITEQTGQQYNCHIEGHKDLGLICCNKCGEEMAQTEQFGELYKRQLAWFVEQYRVGHPNIPNAGRSGKNNKRWFLWRQGNFSFDEYRKQLENLYHSGFQIPDYHDSTKTTQLLAEPYSINVNSNKIFRCDNCENTIKISDFKEFDFSRQNSITKYHHSIFSKEKINN